MSEADQSLLLASSFEEQLEKLRAVHVETMKAHMVRTQNQKDFSDHLQRGNQSLLHKLREVESRHTEKVVSLNDHIVNVESIARAQKQEIDELKARLRMLQQATLASGEGASSANRTAIAPDEELKSRVRELESELAIWERLLKLPLEGRIRMLQVVDGILGDGRLAMTSEIPSTQGTQQTSTDCQACETQTLANAIALKDLNLKWQTKLNSERKIRDRLQQSLDESHKENSELRAKLLELREGDNDSTQRHLSPPPRSHDSFDISNTPSSEDWKAHFEELRAKYNRLVNGVRKNTAKWEEWKRRAERPPPKLEIMNHIAVTDLVKYNDGQDSLPQNGIGDVDTHHDPSPRSSAAVPQGKTPRRSASLASLRDRVANASRSPSLRLSLTNRSAAAAAAAAALAAANSISPPTRQIGQLPQVSSSNPPLKLVKNRTPYEYQPPNNSTSTESRRSRPRESNGETEKVEEEYTNEDVGIISQVLRKYNDTATEKDLNYHTKSRESSSDNEDNASETSQTFPSRYTDGWKSPSYGGKRSKPMDSQETVAPSHFGSFSPRNSITFHREAGAANSAPLMTLNSFPRGHGGWDEEEDDLDAGDKKRKSVGEEDDLLSNFSVPRKKVRTPPERQSMAGILGEESNDRSNSPTSTSSNSVRGVALPTRSTSSTSKSSDAPHVSLSTPSNASNSRRERRITMPGITSGQDDVIKMRSPRVTAHSKDPSLTALSDASSPTSLVYEDEFLLPTIGSGAQKLSEKRKVRPVSDVGHFPQQSTLSTPPGKPEVRARVYSESKVLENPGFGRNRTPTTKGDSTPVPSLSAASRYNGKIPDTTSYTPAPSSSSASSKKGSVAHGSDLDKEAWENGTADDGDDLYDDDNLMAERNGIGGRKDAGIKNRGYPATMSAKKKGGVTYKYDETVRGKDARKMMHGVDCPCCERFYKAAGPVPIPENARPPPFRARSPESTPTEDQLIQQHIQEVSRHRHINKPPNTPPGYWKVDFPNTQEIKEWNLQAKENDRAKQAAKGREQQKAIEKDKRRTTTTTATTTGMTKRGGK